MTERDATIDEYYYYDKDGSMSKEEMEKEKRVEVTAETLATLLEVGVENQVSNIKNGRTQSPKIILISAQYAETTSPIFVINNNSRFFS